MKPTMSMFANKEEWQQALIKWMSEDPTAENNKNFMLFSDNNTSPENLVFDGDISQFRDCFFETDSWADILEYANENGYEVVIEGDDQYDVLSDILDTYFSTEEEKIEPTFEKIRGKKQYDDGGY